MRILFNFIIDALLFCGDFICHMPSRIFYVISKIGYGVNYVIEVLPYKISLIYRFRRMWYPVKSNFRVYDLTEIHKKWMNDNIGKYRWKVISRKEGSGYDIYSKPYLCFRYKTDVVAFKLRWAE